VIELVVDVAQLREGLVPFLRDLPDALHQQVIRKTLNRVGDQAQSVILKGIAAEASIQTRFAKLAVDVERATISEPRYRIVVLNAWMAGLVNIQTMGDEKVCPICAAAERSGPFRVKDTWAAWPHVSGGEISVPLHPKCRCKLIPVEVSLGQKLDESGPIMKSATQLVRDQLPVVFAEEYKFAVHRLTRKAAGESD
jgi:hypothetical protein